MQGRVMKIAVLVHDYTALGGTERVTLQLCNQLSQYYDVTLISVQNTKKTPYFKVYSAVDVAYLSNGIASMMKTLPAKARALRNLVITKNFDVLIASDSQMALISLPATIMTDVKNVVWEHFNASIETRFGSRWFARRLAAYFASRILVLTEQDQQTWLSKFRCRAKVSVFHNPCAFKRPSQNSYSNEKVVLAAGRYTEQKGFDLLVNAWNSISLSQRKEWTLRIVGPNGSARRSVEELASSHSNIQLDNSMDDMTLCYKNSGLFVCSSRYEGFGLTIVEAMTFGVPVVAFDCPMGPSEIIDGQYGLMVENGNVEALSQAIVQFIDNESLRREMSKKAYERSRDYTVDVIILRWKHMLNELVS